MGIEMNRASTTNTTEKDANSLEMKTKRVKWKEQNPGQRSRDANDENLRTSLVRLLGTKVVMTLTVD
jgi:hypothetical protein